MKEDVKSHRKHHFSEAVEIDDREDGNERHAGFLFLHRTLSRPHRHQQQTKPLHGCQCVDTNPKQNQGVVPNIIEKFDSERQETDRDQTLKTINTTDFSVPERFSNSPSCS